MAQTVVTGLTGTMTIAGNTFCRTYSFRCTLQQDALESSGFGSPGNARQRELGFNSASGQFGARMTRGTSNDNPTSPFSGVSKYTVVLTFNSTPGCTVSFTAIITTTDLAARFDAVGEVTGTFVSDGQIVTQWDVT